MQKPLILSLGLIVISVVLLGSRLVNGSSASIEILPTTTPLPMLARTLGPDGTEMFNAIYQPFERGMMIWREDLNCAYAVQYHWHTGETTIVIPYSELPDTDQMKQYSYCQAVEGLADRSGPATPHPKGDLRAPQGAIGHVWRFYMEFQNTLGYATGSETAYVATIPHAKETSFNGGAPYFSPMMTLPDGSVLMCGFRAASAGCYVDRDYGA